MMATNRGMAATKSGSVKAHLAAARAHEAVAKRAGSSDPGRNSLHSGLAQQHRDRAKSLEGEQKLKKLKAGRGAAGGGGASGS